MSAMIPFFSSCSDDDSVNEWDMSYVFYCRQII